MVAEIFLKQYRKSNSISLKKIRYRDVCFLHMEGLFFLKRLEMQLEKRTFFRSVLKISQLEVIEIEIETRLITMRSKPDYVEFVLL